MPRSSNSAPNVALLEAALEGLQLQRSRIDEQIAEVRRLLGQRAAPARSGATAHSGGFRAPRARRALSAAARKRIAAAQKRRWAEYRKQAAGAEARASKSAAPKRAGAAKTASKKSAA
jgi:hypothetical protein